MEPGAQPGWMIDEGLLVIEKQRNAAALAQNGWILNLQSGASALLIINRQSSIPNLEVEDLWTSSSLLPH
jgi:hypothetical protein